MRYLRSFNENLDPDFVSEVRDVFSYVIDSYEVNVQVYRFYLSFTFLFNFRDDYKGLIEDLKLDIEECLERLSITRSFYYKTAYGVSGTSVEGRPIFVIQFNDGLSNDPYMNNHLQDYQYRRKIG